MVCPLSFFKYVGTLWEILSQQQPYKFLKSGQFPLGFNHTFITLIPKKNQVAKMSNFRSIGLCNVVYKLISKVILNRLKVFLPSIILKSQSAFVLERQIIDNILIAYKMLHFLMRKKKSKAGFMSIILDMNKAYENVKWSYLRRVMMVMGLKPRLLDLILSCVSSTSLSVLVNRSLKGRHIIPSRDLRQGDPLSPYLFLFLH